MIVYICISIAMAAVLALLITIIVDHKHDSEERIDEEMMQSNYFICEGIENKRKTYIAVPKDNMREIPAKQLANNKYFKTKIENLISTIGYIKDGQLYMGLLPENTKADKMWIIYRAGKKEDK